MKVKGEGNHASKIWLIGEAPGSQEERTGRPFVGGAGRIMDGMLQDTGIKRDETYIDNVVQERPPKNDFGIYYTDKARYRPTDGLRRQHQQLRDLLIKHRPNVVVALGNEPLMAIMGHRGIMKWRGSILNFEGIKVIPVIHPAMVMRQYEFRPVCVLDLHRVKKESTTPAFPHPYNDKFIINPPFDKVMSMLDFLERQPRLTFDIETAQNQITCIGFAWSKEDAICIPIFYGGNSWWNHDEELIIVKRIRKLFSNPAVKFIAQNAQFDMTYIKDKWGAEPATLELDTMIAFHCIYPELRKGLDFLSSIYTNRPYHKDSGKGGPTQLWHYNCLDTTVTFECAEAIIQELKEFKTWEFYKNNSHKLIVPLMEMQRRGVRIDLVKRKKIDDNLQGELEAMQRRLVTVVGHDLNPNSPKQMQNFLYDELKLPPQRNRKTGNLSADTDAIEFLAKRFPNPVFSLVLDIRKVRKLLSTYIRAPLDADGRIRCSYVITGTKTGRLSSRESIYGSGTNLQNVPRGEIVRSIFIPDRGKRFIDADLSQAEARVVAALAEEGRLQAIFEDAGGDIHKRNAAMVFEKRVEDITKDERQLAKTLVHAANYGIGARTFSKHIGSSEGRARELLNKYYASYPRIKCWHLEVEDQLRKSRILRTPMGRARMFFGRWSPELVRSAIAYVPQSTVGDILNAGLIQAYNNLPPEWDCALQVHDNVVLQVPIEAANMHIYKFIKHYFERSITINRTKLTIPVEIKTGDNWANMKPLEV